MDILSNETIALTISYLLPGFIINSIFSYVFPIEKDYSSNIILRYLFFGFLNYLVVFLIDFASMGYYLVNNPVLIKSLRTIGMPMVIGIILIVLSKFSFFKKLLNMIGLSSINSIPTAWDYIFYNVSNAGGLYVTVTLKDYQEIYGYFNEDSFASSLRPSSNNDIYLDMIYEDDLFQKELKSGILLSQNDILAINFHKTDNDNEEEEKILK